MKGIVTTILALSLVNCTEQAHRQYGMDPVAPYYNGEILYPDYVQSDTLIVSNAQSLNDCINRTNPTTDGEIAECLKANTKPYTRVEIIQRTTDNRGLTSVMYRDHADTFALDYLTAKELDSLINLK